MTCVFNCGKEKVKRYSRRDKMALVDVDLYIYIFFFVRNCCSISLELNLQVLRHDHSKKFWTPDWKWVRNHWMLVRRSKHRVIKTQSTRPRFKHRNLALSSEFKWLNYWPIYNIQYTTVCSMVWLQFKRLGRFEYRWCLEFFWQWKAGHNVNRRK